MGGLLSKPESSQSTASISSISRDNSHDLAPNNEIHRLTTDQSATIGSLYDARKDRIVYTPTLNMPSMSILLNAATSRAVTSSGELTDKNLADIIGIDRELSLSIYLKFTASKGISLFLNSPFPINEHTRFLSYYYPTKRSYRTGSKTIDISKGMPKWLATVDITHVITEIHYGIHVVVILQLSPEYIVNFDHLLEKIQKQLATNIFNIDTNEEHLLHHITNIRTFSNIPDMVNLTNLRAACQRIIQILPNISEHSPIQHTLRPIRSLCPSYPIEKAKYVQLNQVLMDQIQPYLYSLLWYRKQLKVSLNSIEEQSIIKYFRQRYKKLQQQRLEIEEMYQKTIDRLPHLIVNIRTGGVDQDALQEPLISAEDTVLLNETRNVTEQLNVLIEKTQLINDWKKRGIEYWNVKELIKEDTNNREAIEQQLREKSKEKHIFCFDDKLEKQSLTQWNDRTKEVVNGHKTNELVYADFSFCVCKLPKMKILSPNKSNEQRTSDIGATPSKKQRLDEASSSRNNIINVLLLGESGVGKSTFINAIVNYFKFDTLHKARSGKPIALMPVSFLLTVGDQFDEHIVTFGDKDTNEDHHHHPGQSVTQHCKSYVFSIGTQTKVRFIDTPGMGDTRGLDQDDHNMQHILSFINNLSHLNAICILLKPNESRLNVVFRSYFTRLLGFLGENIRHNIIFCFTNTRSTFFAPGNTGPLLKKMLESHSIKNIPFKKENTFCFDSEAFRYLIALENGITFDDYQTQEYIRSWVTSVNESTRFLRYMCNNIASCSQKDWQSIEHAQYQINQMIRPTLETIRNNMRNILLMDNKSSKALIQLCANAVPRNSMICRKCPRFPVLHGDVWILPDEIHTFSDKCDKCPCTFSEHSQVNYTLEYKPCSDKRKPAIDDLKANLDRRQCSVIGFVEFFKYVVRISEENDPIFVNLCQMIEEENYIQSQKQQPRLNLYLYKKLQMLKKEYDNIWSISMSNQKSVTLPEIYKQIKNLTKDTTINEQMDVIKRTQQQYMNEQEKHIF